MKHIKKFEALIIQPIKYTTIPIDEFNNMIEFLTKNEEYCNWNILHPFSKVKGEHSLSNDKNNIKISNKLIDGYNEIRGFVDEAEFIEDCFIELIDNGMKIVVNPGLTRRKFFKVEFIKENSINNMKLIIDTILSNKFRFECNIIHMYDEDNVDGYSDKFNIEVAYKLLKEI